MQNMHQVSRHCCTLLYLLNVYHLTTRRVRLQIRSVWDSTAINYSNNRPSFWYLRSLIYPANVTSIDVRIQHITATHSFTQLSTRHKQPPIYQQV